MIAQDLPDPIRRRLSLPPIANTVVQNLKHEMFANSRRYMALVLDASADREIDNDELMEAARLAGKSPAIVCRDLERAMAAYRLWQESVDP